ncbi:nitroreductase family protein [Thiovibrio frasassiensis]|uniref:Nitroreductase family protein n=1 Tax=Thiovibrio frasassiensis TaxID=2984131 RepID=A0A9X4MMF1_9BACT|nr:nitroreductase family protein [Thiovibrio frasassiensis]MDG4475472.1 nitroreductase family protein [Thiovibrio frasassiensis]
MLQFRIDEERCIQCGECALECPAGVIVMDPQPKITNEAGCFQCQHCLAVCPTAAVSILGKDPDASMVLAGNLPDPARLATLIKGRRAVRRYHDHDLPPELIEHLLEVSCHAPTGVNARSVLFTVVRERAVMHRLREHLMARIISLKADGALPEGLAGQYLGWSAKAWQEEGKDILFRGAPHLLITSVPADAPCAGQDPLIALTTFQLLAHAHGVGTVWDGICMMALAFCPEVVGRLGIPKNHILGYAIAFGEPAVEYQRTVQRGPAQVNVVTW